MAKNSIRNPEPNGKLPIDKFIAIWQVSPMEKLKTHISDNYPNLSAYAVELGVSVSTVTRLLRGERQPGLDLLERIEGESGGKITAQDFYSGTISITPVQDKDIPA